MESGCSLPMCDSIPVARKWQRGGAAKWTITDHDGQTVYLVARSRVSASLLFANAPSTHDATRLEEPAWMRDHLQLLYNGVRGAESNGRRRKTKGGNDDRGAAVGEFRNGDSNENVSTTDAASPDTTVAMFHGLFGLAEHQRRERLKQENYPF